jgi:hypothetical protein
VRAALRTSHGRERTAGRSRRPRKSGRQGGRTVRTAPGPGRRGWR